MSDKLILLLVSVILVLGGFIALVMSSSCETIEYENPSGPQTMTICKGN